MHRGINRKIDPDRVNAMRCDTIDEKKLTSKSLVGTYVRTDRQSTATASPTPTTASPGERGWDVRYLDVCSETLYFRQVRPSPQGNTRSLDGCQGARFLLIGKRGLLSEIWKEVARC